MHLFLHVCVVKCVRLTTVVMSDKLLILSYKGILSCATKTHILLSRPDSLPTSLPFHTNQRYQCRDWERHATLSLCTWECPYRALYNPVDSTASGKSRTGTVLSPGLSLICWRRQVQAAVVQRAPESYLVSADFWPLRKRVQQMRRRSLSAAEGRPEWVISLCQHMWGLLPAAARHHASVHICQCTSGCLASTSPARL